MIWAWLTGKGLKFAGIGLAIVACAGFGFKKGLDWRADQVESVKVTAAKEIAWAEGKTDRALARATQAEADYTQLRQQVADAMQAAQEQAIRIEQENADAQQKAVVGYEKRVGAVLDGYSRLLNSSTQGGGHDSRVEVSALPRARCAHDSAAERVIIERLREGDLAEARLIELQNLIKEQ